MKKAVLIDSGRIKRIHAQLAQIGLANDKEYKRELVQTYTHGRETSTTGLFADEADLMIGDLQETIGKSLSPDKIKGNQKRKLMCHYAHEMMWYKKQSAQDEARGAKPELDTERLNNWCIVSGYLHKPWMEYTTAELSKLVWQFQQAHQDFLQSV